MADVFSGVLFDTLKRTLNRIVDDNLDGYEDGLIMKRYCEEMSMEDAFEDDLEVGGPGLASETVEGSEVPTGTIKEGYLTRYLARKFGLKLIITEEVVEDTKYPKAISAARRLKRALYKTADIDAAFIPTRGWNTSFPGGDGLPLFSASHTIAAGGTFSNTLATPLSPSRAAVVIATSQARKFPGHDGITEGYEPNKVVHPTEQWAVWEEIVNSTHAPEAGEFNRINVVNQSLKIELVPVKYWTNTTTNWYLGTDCDAGINFRWKRRPKSRTYVENSNEVMVYSISARWARGWSDPRTAIGSQA